MSVVAGTRAVRCVRCRRNFPLTGTVCVPCAAAEGQWCKGCGGSLGGFGADVARGLCFTCSDRVAERRRRETEAWNSGYAAGKAAEAEDGALSLDETLVRRLIVFCHPDRHPDRSEEANALTALLLEERDALREARQ